MWGISLLPENRLATQVGLYSMELVLVQTPAMMLSTQHVFFLVPQANAGIAP
jgi:hypothetical protein